MKSVKLLYLLLIIPFLNSCLTRREVQYVQPNENLTINDKGYIPYNIPEYRVNKNDILKVTVITTPKGDAAQFYSSLVASTSGGTGAGTSGASGTNSNNFYFNGFRLDDKGDINVFGMGYIKAEGRTTDEIAADIQQKVNENFLPEKSQVRVSLEGIKYYILSDLEGKAVTQTARVNTLNILEMLAENGGLDRTVDRKKIRLYRKYPEGMKLAVLDVTRDDIMNSPYFYVQNGDMFLLDSKPKSLNGFNKNPIQTVTTAVGLFTTALSIYLLFTRL
ncbi:polysaccharide biosynthesis/export family protein [Elizabethkingia sp. JS20170427COW]|uniref:polysaccharide biosynthesis/export family protein n=1 Tax=Elizabethkingia sp. JS20170427COW TaxID=2583851 RepID=UPI0016263F28|nr:polysaccharide biosynthesis/export family protein [Elizabethkingia sp. JS20170427COW]